MGIKHQITYFDIVTWYGNLTVKNRTKLSRTVNIASKIVGSRQLQLSHLYQVFVKRKTRQILNNTTQPLDVCLVHRNLYTFIPSAAYNACSCPVIV